MKHADLAEECRRNGKLIPLIQSEIFDPTCESNKPHMRMHSGGKNHKCSECGKIFTRAWTLSVHTKKKHGPGSQSTFDLPMDCPVGCGVKLKTHSGVGKHVLTHTGEKHFKCKSCPSTFATFHLLKFHNRIHSGNEPFVCSVCSRKFIQRYAYVNHIKTHDEIRQCYKCSNCEGSWLYKSKFTEHLKSPLLQKEEEKICHEITCRKRFNRDSCYSMHMFKIHPIRCQICGKLFRYLRSFKKHTADRCGSKFECGFCRKKFESRHGLEEHVRMHIGEKPLKCETCGEMFSTTWQIDSHIINNHTVREKSFKCGVESCDKSYYKRRELISHQKITHRNERPFECKFCQKAFPTKTRMIVHMLSHTNERPFPCQMCELSCRSKSALTAHEKITHGKGIPKVKCPNCPKTFFFQAQLRTHELTHTGEKKYPCPTCKKMFRNPRNVKLHIQYAHLNEKPHVCKICSKGFGHISNMVAHMKIHTR